MTARHVVVASALYALGWVCVPASAQHQMSPGTPGQHRAGEGHDEHQKQLQKDAELKKRGGAAMGFDQDATTHQFLLADDGGSIEVSVKDSADTTNLAAIRAHLEEIATAFKQGDFSKPFQTHAEVPPGVDGLKASKDAITYTYEETPGGGRVRIRTAQPQAIDAVHQFLRYQTREHHTASF